jgi:phosphate transport system permease protein
MMKRRSVRPRKILDIIMKIISVLAALLGIFFLFWILFVVLSKGFAAFNKEFFTEVSAYGVEGGVANAIVGTFIITFLATLIGVPLGILGGIFLSEFGRSSKIGDYVRFSANVMMGMPSIVIGLFVYTLIVANIKSFSGFAGAVALAIIMFPVVLRTTEDMFCLVPNALREAALALGAPRWKVTIHIVFRAAKTGLVTGVLLAIARVSGETAPLLFTALNTYFWPFEPWWKFWEIFNNPTPNLTVTINDYAMSPFDGLNKIAWGASLIITITVLILNLTARILFREDKK